MVMLPRWLMEEVEEILEEVDELKIKDDDDTLIAQRLL